MPTATPNSEPAGDFTLRDAQPGDEAEVQRIVRAVLEEFDLGAGRGGTDADLADIGASYAARGGAFRVATDAAGRIVGCGGLYPLDDGDAEIRKMYLLPPARGRGLGRRLLDDLLEAAASGGFRRVVLETASAFKNAIDLYRSAGFTPIQRQRLTSRCDQAFALDLETRRGASSAPPH
jgi:putative acetyltransferase